MRLTAARACGMIGSWERRSAGQLQNDELTATWVTVWKEVLVGNVRVLDVHGLPWDPPEGVHEGAGLKPNRKKSIGDSALKICAAVAEQDPNTSNHAHSHAQHELLYILEGQVTIGGQLCTPGTALLIDGHTVYGPLVTGDEGVRFMIVRSHEPAPKPL